MLKERIAKQQEALNNILTYDNLQYGEVISISRSLDEKIVEFYRKSLGIDKSSLKKS